MRRHPSFSFIHYIARKRPEAMAIIQGDGSHPTIRGNVLFFQSVSGVIVSATVTGLPAGADNCDHPIFGFHIHSGEHCAGNENDPFADTMGHYNPHQCPHPYHAGDLPPLFGVKGMAFACFLTDRFTLHEIIGKTMIIHSRPDDFTSQPAGNAGEKIACGVIARTWR